MVDISQSQEVASWVQTGGLLAFASAVYWEIRQIRPWMKSIAEALAVLKDRDGIVGQEVQSNETPRTRRLRRVKTNREGE